MYMYVALSVRACVCVCVVAVTFSAAAIYSYWWLVPALLWLVLRWRGNKAGVSFLELLCVYGYSLAIYIPISVRARGG